jgi:hypothetical protein
MFSSGVRKNTLSQGSMERFYKNPFTMSGISQNGKA